MIAGPPVRLGLSVSSFLSPFRRYSSLDNGAIQRLKNPTRGGQNLSLRYRRLEKSLRGKEALQQDIRAREAEVADTPGTNATSGYFHGFKIPQRPKPPEFDECCMSGCAVCVYDLYEESLATYKESMAAFRKTLTAAEIPEASWPDSARSTQAAAQDKKSVTLSAFEELEQSLKEKRAAKEGEPQ
ncbi:oxidoreductase-like protein [Mycena latifolia]|nr:oxidoreductase-like protein [Mycena latifolia]